MRVVVELTLRPHRSGRLEKGPGRGGGGGLGLAGRRVGVIGRTGRGGGGATSAGGRPLLGQHTLGWKLPKPHMERRMNASACGLGLCSSADSGRQFSNRMHVP